MNLFDDMTESLSPREKWARDNKIYVSERPDNPPEQKFVAIDGASEGATPGATRADALDALADFLFKKYAVPHWKKL